MTEEQLVIGYLTGKGLTIEKATKGELSHASAYASCYKWYIDKMQVLHENAELAAKVWVDKYALCDKSGVCLEATPEDMWRRIAHTLAVVEMNTNKSNSKTQDQWEAIFYAAMEDFKSVPGGSALSVIGNDFINSSCSNCFVVGTEDSIEGIMKTASEMARLQSYRGGTGIDLSPLRPSGSPVHNSARYSTGAVSFMDFFSKVTATIGQAGRCLREDQRVLTSYGLTKIKDVKSGDLVWSQKGWIKNLNTIFNGVKPTYKLTTSRGLELIASDNHIISYMSSDKTLSEKQLKDFSIGDSIVCIPGDGFITPKVSLDTTVNYIKGHGANNLGNRLNESVLLPNQLSEDLAYFIGYAFGDGNVERDAWETPQTLCLACAHSYPDIQSKLTNIIFETFGYSAKINTGDGAVNKVTIHSKLILLFLQQNGLLKQPHHSLIMPDAVKNSPLEVQAAFISGYFDADGYASGSKKGYVIASVCQNILREMQNMLFSFGIVSHITMEKKKRGTHKDLFSLYITGKIAQTKTVSLLSASCKIAGKGFISKKDTILTPFNPKALSIQYNKFSFIGDNSQNISTSGYVKLKTLNVVTDEFLVLDTVVSIGPCGNANVYDLQLESHHRFYCEGFNVHNSGATMISIDSSHPDIEKFIEEKQDLDKKWFFDELNEKGIDINDWKHTAIATRLKSTSKANVSVKAYDEFMTAVDKDTDYELRYVFKDNKYPKISKWIKARSLWEKLIDANVSSAEPGVLYWDTILRESVSDCYAGIKDYSVTLDGKTFDFTHDFTTVSTNPCQPAYTRILTEKGYRELKDLVVGEQVWTGEQFSPLLKKWSTGIKPVNRYHMSTGVFVDATEYHRVVCGGLKTPIKDAASIDRMTSAPVSFVGNTTTIDEAILAGLVFGDGSKQKNGGKSAYLNLGEKDGDVLSWINRFSGELLPKNEAHCTLYRLNLDFKDLHLNYTPLPERVITPFWIEAEKTTQQAFLRGLYSANGSVIKTSRVALKTTNKETAQIVCDMLANFGMRSYITVNKAKKVKFSNGDYICKESYDVNTLNSDIFMREIGFMQDYKNTDLATLVEKRGKGLSHGRKVRVVAVEPIGEMEVFDYTVEATEHTVTQHGLLISNCSELPLPVGSACTLLSQNLTRYISNPWTKEASFDATSFEKDVRISTRMLDNIKEYDIPKLPLLVNRVDATLSRRIGLGCHGLADALAALGLRYDTQEAIDMTYKIYNLLANTVYDESVTLGIEKGSFPIWDWELEKNNPFILRLDKKVRERIKKFGRRNIACLTNAPTGTLSIISRNCSSGIEPVFKLNYLRNVKKQGSEETIQHTIYHQALQDCLAVGGKPEVFVEANDVKWEFRIQMQQAVQLNLDHSVSSTVNLPTGTPKETVSAIYLAAWKAGLKGITTYIEGVRSGVLVDVGSLLKDDSKESIVRPKTTSIDIHKVKYKDKPWCVLVGHTSTGPIEIFAGIEEDTPLPNKYYKAELSKKSRGHYALTVWLSSDEDSDIIKIGNIGARFPLPEGMVLTRFISLSLRNRVPISEICEQLQKSSNSMFDYPNVLNRVLREYIPSHEVVKREKAKNKLCPECGTELDYKREAGCLTELCPNCSYSNSKCS